MKLKCLGSSSSGNCYILENETEALVIEAGLPLIAAKRALDFNVRKIKAVIVSHVHGDHVRYLKDYEKAGITVLKPYEIEDYAKRFKFGNFSIMPFPLVHDVPCFGFFIENPEMGSMVYISDTEYVKYRFKNLNHILVECNYDKNFIQDDTVNHTHVLEGHMELQTTKEFIKVNNNPDLRNVVLLHLSASNSNPKEFKEEIENLVECPVWIAEKGLEIDLRLVPF